MGTDRPAGASKPYMGQLEAAWVDPAVLRDVARAYDSVADTVAAARKHLARLTFDGAVAGRSHTARGEAVRRSVDQIDVALRRWSAVNDEIAAALRVTADRYAESDARAGRRLG